MSFPDQNTVRVLLGFSNGHGWLSLLLINYLNYRRTSSATSARWLSVRFASTFRTRIARSRSVTSSPAKSAPMPEATVECATWSSSSSFPSSSRNSTSSWPMPRRYGRNLSRETRQVSGLRRPRLLPWIRPSRQAGRHHRIHLPSVILCSNPCPYSLSLSLPISVPAQP